jgi:hypothetical protein
MQIPFSNKPRKQNKMAPEKSTKSWSAISHQEDWRMSYNERKGEAKATTCFQNLLPDPSTRKFSNRYEVIGSADDNYAHSGENTRSVIVQYQHTCVVPLKKVVARSSTLLVEMPRSIYGWTRHHRRSYDEPLLNPLSMSYVLLFVGSLAGVSWYNCGDNVTR